MSERPLTDLQILPNEVRTFASAAEQRAHYAAVRARLAGQAAPAVSSQPAASPPPARTFPKFVDPRLLAAKPLPSPPPPPPSGKLFATADEIALAVVEASKYTGENPIEVVRRAHDDLRDKNTGRPASSHAAHFALEALSRAIPGIDRSACARGLGFRDFYNAAKAGAAQAKKTLWWDDRFVDSLAAVIRAECKEGARP